MIGSAPAAALTAYRGVPVLVTGSAGFLGGWVTRLLRELGADVTAVVRPGAAPPRKSGVVPADLGEPGAAARVVAQHAPFVVFNLAGHGVDPGERDPGLAARLNDELVGELGAQVAALPPVPWQGRRLVHAGSALEYGPLDGPVAESEPARPTTLYGRSKLAGARRLLELAERAGLRAVTARIFTAYGPGEHAPRLLPSLWRARSTGEPIELTAGHQERDFIFAGEVAEGLLRLGLVAGPGAPPVNLATGTLTPVRRFVELAAAEFGIPAARLRFGALPYRSEEMWHGPVRVDELRRQTGWIPALDPAAGILRTRILLERTGGAPESAPGAPR